MKKLLSVFLIIMQLTAMTAFADGNSVTDKQKKDLYDLGIMIGDENGDLNLDKNITRAEAIKMLCVTGNYELKSSDVMPFKDVEKSHWAYGYISTAKEYGMFNGDENGNFNPESNITNEEAAKMIVCMLGYEEMAESHGGYPAGYTWAASRTGIMKGLVGVDAASCSVRSDFAIMVHNALDIPLMKKAEEDGEDIYVLYDGKGEYPLETLRGLR